MDKPLTVALDDMRRAVWREINDIKLPATILEPVIAGIHSELAGAARNELVFDRQTYAEALKREAEEAKDENKNAD